jgi:hypothetical protein
MSNEPHNPERRLRMVVGYVTWLTLFLAGTFVGILVFVPLVFTLYGADPDVQNAVPEWIEGQLMLVSILLGVSFGGLCVWIWQRTVVKSGFLTEAEAQRCLGLKPSMRP